MRVSRLLSLLMLACWSASFGQEPVSDAKVGRPAPDFVMTGIDGQDAKLSQLTARGKNVVLMFSRANW